MIISINKDILIISINILTTAWSKTLEKMGSNFKIVVTKLQSELDNMILQSLIEE